MKFILFFSLFLFSISSLAEDPLSTFKSQLIGSWKSGCEERSILDDNDWPIIFYSQSRYIFKPVAEHLELEVIWSRYEDSLCSTLKRRVTDKYQTTIIGQSSQREGFFQFQYQKILEDGSIEKNIYEDEMIIRNSEDGLSLYDLVDGDESLVGSK